MTSLGIALRPVTFCFAVFAAVYLNPVFAAERDTPVIVTVENFAHAETARMFDGGLKLAGGIGKWLHNREPIPLDQQTVIRMNRDTLYSSMVVDISKGATLTIPPHGNRYLSVMVVNEDHYVNRVLHDAGTY